MLGGFTAGFDHACNLIPHLGQVGEELCGTKNCFLRRLLNELDDVLNVRCSNLFAVSPILSSLPGVAPLTDDSRTMYNDVEKFPIIHVSPPRDPWQWLSNIELAHYALWRSHCCLVQPLVLLVYGAGHSNRPILSLSPYLSSSVPSCRGVGHRNLGLH